MTPAFARVIDRICGMRTRSWKVSEIKSHANHKKHGEECQDYPKHPFLHQRLLL